ncbi:uncharacterized protein BCR38DRAFT_438644 [Pseudomassariella vexata]|uniref:Uncharacterized protein n=1 Tax=Pseudomassariella vexata TaxID=1141098 RepID=A0A1Y2DT68_9PEZI|nr:uncharacterized protein BCR38DRAFT_438644 [Pseudomassariella vexata]ORY62463.1 hypothetical protein BCR38DRAFT_438644 [Pseudomassariella vexata]
MSFTHSLLVPMPANHTTKMSAEINEQIDELTEIQLRLKMVAQEYIKATEKLGATVSGRDKSIGVKDRMSKMILNAKESVANLDQMIQATDNLLNLSLPAAAMKWDDEDETKARLTMEHRKRLASSYVAASSVDEEKVKKIRDKVKAKASESYAANKTLADAMTVGLETSPFWCEWMATIRSDPRFVPSATLDRPSDSMPTGSLAARTIP